MLRRYRLALALWLCAVGMVFVAFTSAYVVRRGVPTYETETGAYSTHWEALHAPIPLLLVNSLLLFGAALGMEIARRRASTAAYATNDKLTPSNSIWMGASLLLIFGFLSGQQRVWSFLHANGESMAAGARPAFFFLLTGAHALNVGFGLLVLIWIALRSTRWNAVKRYIAIDLTAWYLHAMTILWIYLLCFLLLA